ncbi:hypothetical protein BML2496_33360 [Providencia rettgeri]|nr:winged helix-turn-helix domain-containing protein [Providencia sp. PROV075]BBU97453.1 hypothetical protein BML2496_33360 [Providencia rettgeri]
MIYILNNIIKYNSDLGEIFRVDTELSVMKLTPVLNYIFIILIQNNKTTITREEILKKILNKYDLKVSINTLNQYISTLRKVLHQQLLVENAILSISKKGLVISSEIQIEESIAKFNNKIEKSLAPPPTSSNKSNKSLLLSDKNHIIKKTLLIISVFLLLVIIYLINQIHAIKFPYASIQSYKISTIGDCPVYGFKDNYEKNMSDTISKQAIDFNLTCEDSDVFYYYNNIQNLGKNKHSLLVKCKKNKECISTRVNWQDKND